MIRREGRTVESPRPSFYHLDRHFAPVAAAFGPKATRDVGPIGYRPAGGKATQPLSSRGGVRLTGAGCGVE